MSKTNKSQKRNKRNQAPLGHNPFEKQLEGCFVNLRQELCTNLDDSRSKVAVAIREKREKAAEITGAKATVRELQFQLTSNERELNDSRSKERRLKAERDRLLYLARLDDGLNDRDRAEVQIIAETLRSFQDYHKDLFITRKELKKAITEATAKVASLTGSN